MLKYELKKIFCNRLNRGLLLATLVLAFVFSAFAIGSFQYTDEEGTVHSGLTAPRKLIADKDRWEGEITPERLEEIIQLDQSVSGITGQASNETYGKYVQSYSDILNAASSILYDTADVQDGTGQDGESAETSMQDVYGVLYADGSTVDSLYDIYSQNMQGYVQVYGKTPRQQEFLQKIYSRIQTPLEYEVPDSWSTEMSYSTTYGLIVIMVEGFLAAGIFSEDYRYKAAPVFFASRLGRDKAVWNKILAGYLVATVVYWGFVLLQAAISFSVMGTSGAHTLYQFSCPYSIYVMTYAQMYRMLLFGGYIASLLAASVSMLAAALTRSMNIAVCLPFLLFCVSPFIGRALPFHTFFTLTPDQLTNILQCVKSPNIYQVFGIVFRQVPFLIGFYLLVSLCLLPAVYQAFRRPAGSQRRPSGGNKFF